MKRAGVRVGTGTRFLYDGEVIEIVKIHCVQGAPEVVARHVRTETVCRLALNELMFSPRSRLLSEHLVVESADVSEESASVRWSAAPESERSKARERAAHVREALTGYQSGTWVRNLRADNRAVLLQGRRENVSVVEDFSSNRAAILRRYLEISAGARPFFPITRRAPLGDFEQIVDEYPVFRVAPAS